jgi:hypothetical protein
MRASFCTSIEIATTAIRKSRGGCFTLPAQTSILAAKQRVAEFPPIDFLEKAPMSESLWRKSLVASLAVLAVGLVIGNGALSIGQEAKAKKAKGRLPAYFADIVTDEQRTAIYKIQESYKKQIDDLEAQLAAAREKEMTEIEALLDAEQKEKLKKAREEAAAKKKKKTTTDAAAAESKPTVEKPATTTVKPKKAG